MQYIYKFYIKIQKGTNRGHFGDRICAILLIWKNISKQYLNVYEGKIGKLILILRVQ